MKKILTRILIAVLTLILLCGCGGISPAVASDDNSNTFSSITWDTSNPFYTNIQIGTFIDQKTGIEYIIAFYSDFYSGGLSITPRVRYNGDPVYYIN